MSQHHRRDKWSTQAPKHRARITLMLPQPCIDCGNAVHPGDQWQVGHRVPASQGGTATVGNIGPSHTGCNLRAGGRLGAKVTNLQRAARTNRRDPRDDLDIRAW